MTIKMMLLTIIICIPCGYSHKY